MAFERNNTAGDFETMLRRHLAHSSRLNAPCAEFDPEAANAYLEGALGEASRSHYESHLAACTDCRHAIVALNRLSPAIAPELSTIPAREPVAEWWQSVKDGLRMPGWRYAMVGMATLVVAFGAYYALRRPSQTTAPLTAIGTDEIAPQAAPTPNQTATEVAGNVVPPMVSRGVVGGIEPRAEEAGQLARARLNTSSGILAGRGQAAQNVISGKVSSIGGVAVAEAEVVLIDSVSQQAQAATRTDALGQFRLPAVPEGNYRLNVQAEGYAPQQISDLRPIIAQDVQVKLDLGPSGRQAIVSLQQRSVATETDDKKDAAKQEMVAQRQDVPRRAEASAPPSSTASSAANEGNSRPVPDAAARRLAPQEAKAAKPQPTPNRSNEDENFHALLRKVRDKTFRFDRGVWVDQEYKPENRLPRVRLNRETPEFEKIISEIPSLVPFFDLGKVIVVWQGRVYEVRK
ncbi:MAG: carboxypeptidase regulatory-like domain-containing protein [Acidobacteriota bacterium]